jgi:alcohol dehydrogenase YqhD (iron-dependent ADH family)
MLAVGESISIVCVAIISTRHFWNNFPLLLQLSDDDGAESDDSIHTMTEAESKISYKQFGAIRKAG